MQLLFREKRGKEETVIEFERERSRDNLFMIVTSSLLLLISVWFTQPAPHSGLCTRITPSRFSVARLFRRTLLRTREAATISPRYIEYRIGNWSGSACRSVTPRRLYAPKALLNRPAELHRVLPTSVRYGVDLVYFWPDYYFEYPERRASGRSLPGVLSP